MRRSDVKSYAGVICWIHSAGWIRSTAALMRAIVSSLPISSVMSNMWGYLHSPTTAKAECVHNIAEVVAVLLYPCEHARFEFGRYKRRFSRKKFRQSCRMIAGISALQRFSRPWGRILSVRQRRSGRCPKGRLQN